MMFLQISIFLLFFHIFFLQVKTSNAEKKFYSVSNPVTVRTYEQPRDIIMLASGEHSLTVGWTSPSDGSVEMHTFQYKSVSNS